MNISLSLFLIFPTIYTPLWSRGLVWSVSFPASLLPEASSPAPLHFFFCRKKVPDSCAPTQHFFTTSLTFSSMESTQLRRQVAVMRQSLFDQGYLDEQFVQLEELQDSDNPNFVEEVVTLFFRDSARLIVNIDQALECSPLDFNKLDNYMHQFKGSASSIGAKKVKNESTQFREYCRAGNAEGCMIAFQQVKKEYGALRKKLETYFQLARQAGPAETACRSARN